MKRIFVLLIVTCLYGAELIDLEKNCQSFVLETKQISIPGFPGAFNPSVARWRDSLIMSFRVRNENMISTFDIGLVALDEDFNPVGAPTILEVRGEDRSCPSKKQDPRLLVVGQELYILYSNFTKIGDVLTRRMFVARIQGEDGKLFIEKPVCLQPFEGWSERWEKNWPPFEYEGSLLIAYGLLPHRVFKPDLQTGQCATASSTESRIAWDWGELRGGSPALLIDGEYLGFFHSSKVVPTVHSQGKNMQHYVMGAYTFSAQPPFHITRISPEPIVGKNFYHGPSYNTWKPLRVVFPMGFVCDQDTLWVTYGRQDFEMWAVKLDKKGLYSSLAACAQIGNGQLNQKTIESTARDGVDFLTDAGCQ